MAGMARHHLDCGNTVLLGLVGQHRAVDHVTDGIDILDRCLETRIDLDAAAFGQSDAGLFQPQPVGCRMTADGDKRHIGLDRLGIAATGRLDCQADARLGCLGRFHRRLQAEAKPLLLRHRGEFLGDLVIHAGQNPRQKLDHLDLGAKPRPDRAELEPDIAGADNDQLLRHFRKRQRTGGADDPGLVDLDPGKARCVASCCDQDPLGLVASGIRTVGHRHLAGTVDTGGALQARHLVLLEKEIDACCQAVDDLVLAPHHLRQVELDAAKFDSQLAKAAAGRIGIMLRRVQQRFRRDASHIQAGAAEGRAFFNAGHAHAELCGADGGNVAARACANHDQVESGLAHLGPPGGMRHASLSNGRRAGRSQ